MQHFCFRNIDFEMSPAAVAHLSKISSISAALCATKAVSSANSTSIIVSFLVLVVAFSRAKLKGFPACLVLIYTPLLVSFFIFIRRTDRKSVKRL